MRTGSKEMSGMMLASRATKKSSCTVAGDGRHKLRPVRIMAASVCLSASVCVLCATGLLLSVIPCVFICPNVISVGKELMNIRTKETTICSNETGFNDTSACVGGKSSTVEARGALVKL